MGGDRRHGARVLGASMAPAHADPINAPNIQPFPLTCDQTTYTAVVMPGQGGWTPALVTTSNGVCMPDRGGHVTLAFPVPQELFPVEHRFLEIDGHRIHYVDEGAGEIVLLLHGN